MSTGRGVQLPETVLEPGLVLFFKKDTVPGAIVLTVRADGLESLADAYAAP
jgi:hypothetical protein